MSNSGQSLIGVVQQQATETAENLDRTAEGLRQFEQPLRSCLAHTTAAMGHTHQSDVPEMQGVVESAIKAIGGCADTTASAAKGVRDIESRT